LRTSRRRVPRIVAAIAIIALAALVLHRFAVRKRRSSAAPRDESLVLVTGYCNCGKCCGWRRSFIFFGSPVYDYGPMKGKPKKIGVTASGTKAKKGTIAADRATYPFGTHLYVPGYGPGTVEDVGGGIRGRHIDVWFPSHEEARRWGARWLKVERR